MTRATSRIARVAARRAPPRTRTCSTSLRHDLHGRADRSPLDHPPHSDHVGGAPSVLDTFHVGAFVDDGRDTSKAEVRRARRAAEDARRPGARRRPGPDRGAARVARGRAADGDRSAGVAAGVRARRERVLDRAAHRRLHVVGAAPGRRRARGGGDPRPGRTGDAARGVPSRERDVDVPGFPVAREADATPSSRRARPARGSTATTAIRGRSS